jgi:hypothetical protein
MRARPDRTPGSMGRGDGLLYVMLCLTKISRKYFEWSSEIARADLSRVIFMPNYSLERSPKYTILNMAPSWALTEANQAVSLHAAGMSSP